jgi:SAM-dependent methyltransferase
MLNTKTPPAIGYYEKRVKEGYGLQYPDGHVIRIYQHVLSREFEKLNRPARVFDFGCWNGTHAQYFSKSGLKVSGADIVATAVAQAKERLPNSRLEVIDDCTDLPAIFGKDFDLVFSNQVLYFLDGITLERRLDEFLRMLAPGGFFFATMISRNCFYSKHSRGRNSSGLEQVVFTEPERLAGKTTHIRFIDNEEQLRRLFGMFECVQMGRYECDLDMAHSTEHYMFLGRRI